MDNKDLEYRLNQINILLSAFNDEKPFVDEIECLTEEKNKILEILGKKE